MSEIEKVPENKEYFVVFPIWFILQLFVIPVMCVKYSFSWWWMVLPITIYILFIIRWHFTHPDFVDWVSGLRPWD